MSQSFLDFVIPYNHMNQFLKIISLSLSLYIYTHTHIYNLLVCLFLFFWRTLTNKAGNPFLNVLFLLREHFPDIIIDKEDSLTDFIKKEEFLLTYDNQMFLNENIPCFAVAFPVIYLFYFIFQNI